MNRQRSGRPTVRAMAAALVAVACLLLVAMPAAAVPPGWSAPRQVLAQRFGPRHSMAIDKNGSVHIVAEGLTSPGLWYISNAGGRGWFQRQVTHKADYDPSIAVFDDGRVVIAFDRRATQAGTVSTGIYTVSNRTGSFVVKKRYDGNGKYPSIAARGNTRFDVVFQGPHHSLLYRKVTGNGTSSSTIVSHGCCSGTPSIDLDPSGPQVAYSERATNGGAGRLRYAYRTGSGWGFDTVDSHPTRHPEIRIDAHTFEPVFVYVRPGSGTWLRAGGVGGFGPVRLAASYEDPPDVAGRFAVVGNGFKVKLVRIYASPITVTTLASGYDPEIEVDHGKPRVIFNRASGTTNDGIFYTHRN